MLYFSYKHYTPLIGGGSDFFQYYNMYLQPLSFDVAQSPFIYRQFNALITFFIVESGIFYNAGVAFVNPEINQQVFFAAVLSNYIALFFTVNIVSRIIDLEIGRTSISIPLLAGMLCYMSFGVSTYVLTGLAEGWTWFLVALGFYAFRKENLYLFTIVLIISIFQKEVIAIIFAAMSFTFLVISYMQHHQIINKKYLWMLSISVLSFLIYVVIRKFLLPIEGHENQLDPSLLLSTLLESNYLTLKFIVPTLISQNLLYIYILFLFIAIKMYKTRMTDNLYYELRLNYAFSIMVSFCTLFFIGMAAGLGSNIGRVTLVLSPVFSIYIAYYIYLLDKSQIEDQ